MNNNQFCFYGNKIAIEHNQEDKLHRLIIFKTNPFLNYSIGSIKIKNILPFWIILLMKKQ